MIDILQLVAGMEEACAMLFHLQCDAERGIELRQPD